MTETSDNGSGSPAPAHIGKWFDVDFDLYEGALLDFPVDLCIVGLFPDLAHGHRLSGLLQAIDQALHGAIGALRGDGIHAGTEGETLLLSSPPAVIAAGAVLLVGLGEPDAWTPSVAGLIAAVAMREALRLNAETVLFAPSLQDSGTAPSMTGGTASAMLTQTVRVLATAPRTEFARPTLRRWTFAAGLEWRDVTLDTLRETAGRLKY